MRLGQCVQVIKSPSIDLKKIDIVTELADFVMTPAATLKLQLVALDYVYVGNLFFPSSYLDDFLAFFLAFFGFELENVIVSGPFAISDGLSYLHRLG